MKFKSWLTESEEKNINAKISINVPDVRQSENFDCGPCCLRSISQFFQVGPKTEEEFIEICGTSKKDGTHPKQLKKTAEKLGLFAKFYTGLTIESLKSYIDQKKPVIVEIQA
jgi:ABC-type bacteriocin/lantibiotic exporter with double-glycine peptidase domain